MIGQETPIELEDGELSTDPRAYQEYLRLQKEMEAWEEQKRLDPFWNGGDEEEYN